MLYRLIDLGPTPTLNIPVTGDDTFGINVLGEVAYTRYVEIESVLYPHASLFLPNARFGLAEFFHDLHDLAEIADDESIANDISDDGYVVGAIGSSIASPPRSAKAHLWRVAEHSSGNVPDNTLHPTGGSAVLYDVGMGTSTTATGASSNAYAITNGDPGEDEVVVVGYTEITLCEEGVQPRWGFRCEVPSSGSPSQLTALRPSGDVFDIGQLNSSAQGINESKRSAGWDAGMKLVDCGQECESPCQGPIFCVGTGEDGERGCGWDATSSTPPSAPDDLFPIDLGMTDDNQALAYDINDAFNAVGYGNDQDFGCVNRATFWPDTSSTENPVTLGDVMPPDEDEDESRAYAVNEPEDGCVIVAGVNATVFNGTVWIGDGSDFCAHNLNSLTIFAGASEVLAGHDVNDWGWVVGTASFIVGEVPTVHASLLVQAGDINLDGSVDGADLGLLNARWLMSGTPEHLHLENVDGEGVVNGGDQGILLANWGDSRDIIMVSLDCEYCGSSSLLSGPSQAMSVEAALDSLGFEDHAAFVAWAAESTEAQIVTMGYAMAALVFSGE